MFHPSMLSKDIYTGTSYGVMPLGAGDIREMAIVISKRAFEKLFNDAPKLVSPEASSQTTIAVEGVLDSSGEGVMLTIGAGRVIFEWDSGMVIERHLYGIDLCNRPYSIALRANVITVIMPKE